MFKNISKGELVEDIDDTGLILSNSEEGEFIAQCRIHWQNSKENREFITFCGNLQQKYDISKFEECIKTIELLQSEIYSIHSQFGDKQNAIDNSFALRKSEELLKQVKK